ncbi:hypothetical protein D3C80_731880 [compost metagenome]
MHHPPAVFSVLIKVERVDLFLRHRQLVGSANTAVGFERFAIGQGNDPAFLGRVELGGGQAPAPAKAAILRVQLAVA